MVGLLLSTVAAAQDSTPVPVNAVGDLGAILASGGWSHKVPLELPPAANGHVPGVAVVADHRVPDGLLGVGWRLEGFSTIERRSATNGVPDMTGTDLFYVDGVRLYPDAGPNTYRLEKDDNRVFVFSPTANRWEVHRDGWQWRYGEFLAGTLWRGLCATETRLQSKAAPCEEIGFRGDAVEDAAARAATTAWHLSRVKDPSQNEIVINYTSNADLSVIGDIFGATIFTPGDFAFQHVPRDVGYADGKHAIFFEYESRPDARIDSKSGRVRVLPARLKAIQVQVNATAVRVNDARYEFIYQDDDLVPCPGEIDFRDADVDVEASTVLHRIMRATAGPGGVRRTLRCIETDKDSVLLDSSAISLGINPGSVGPFDGALYPDTGDPDPYTANIPMAVNFDGDPYPDLVSWRYHCPSTSGAVGVPVVQAAWDKDTPIFRHVGASCSFEHRYWENTDDGTGSLVESTALDTVLSTITKDTFEGGAWAAVDINRDGATDLIEVDEDASHAYWETTFTLGGRDGFVLPATVDQVFDPEHLQEGQFVDIDGDAFMDLVYEGEWFPNLGAAPWFDLSAGGLTITSAFDEPYSDAWTTLETLKAFPSCEPTGAPISITWDASTGVPTHLKSGEPVYADLNGDGIADQAYAFFPCWSIDKSDPDNWTYEPIGEIFSRVFYGDGTGGFHDAEVEVGPAFEHGRVVAGSTTDDLDFLTTIGGPAAWRVAQHWSISDMDRSGHLEVVYGDFLSSTDPLPLLLAPDLGLPEGFGLVQGEQACGHAVCESDFVASSPLGDAGLPIVHQLLADWDGDGFPDLLRLEIGYGENGSAHLYRNLRDYSRNRIKTIHDAWGGEIALTYQSSAEAGDNHGLPYTLEVIASVDGEMGLTAFSFEGGAAHGGRFMGFAEADVRYESGRLSSLRYAVSPQLAGDPISRTEYRPDGTIETFTWYQYFEAVGSPAEWYLDADAPYFNPVLRQCDFWLGPGHGATSAPLQSLKEHDLVRECVEWGNNPSFRDIDWMAALGWARGINPAYQPDAAVIEEGVWSGTGQWTSFSSEMSSSGGWPELPQSFNGRQAYPAVDGVIAENVPQPVPPEPLSVAGAISTDFEMFMEEWVYNSYQRVIENIDYRRVTMSGDISEDSVHVEYDLDTWDVAAYGQRILGITWRDPSGAELRSVEHPGAWAAFDRPLKVVERGEGGAGFADWDYTYQSGEVTSVTDPDDAYTSFSRNHCGLPTTKTDAEGRVWSGTYDHACRLTDWSWEGSTGSIEYDGFGRMYERTVIPRAGSLDPAQTETWLRDDFLSMVDDRTTRAEPRSAVVLGDGSMRLSYLDPWGRPFYDVVCESQPGSATGVSSILAEKECVPGTQTYQFRAWARDGQLRMETTPYKHTEVPASVWTWHDAFGRVEYQYDPVPEPVLYPLQAEWVESSFEYYPGRTVSIDPGLHECTTTYTTIETETNCEGAYRGGRTLDRLGRVVQQETPDGVLLHTSYDALGRPQSRALGTGIAVYPSGASTLEETWSWTPGGRLLTATDAAGNQSRWQYDDLGRTRFEYFTPAGAGEVLVSSYTYQDWNSGLGRFVESTDVNGNGTTTHLDGLDRAWRVRLPDASLREASWDAAGRLASTLGINGERAHYGWNPDGTLASETEPLTLATRTYEYDGAGRVIAEVDRDGVITQHGWTWDGRAAWTERELAAGGAWTLRKYKYNDDGLAETVQEGGVVNVFRYDKLHRRELGCIGYSSFDGASCGGVMMSWTYTPSDLVQSVARTRGSAWPLTTTYTYNDAGWPTTVTHPDSTMEAWDYGRDGLPRRHRDESSLYSYWDYDGWGRLTTETLPGQGLREFTYAFAATGGLEEHVVTEPDGGVWTTWYDFARRAVAQKTPDGTGYQREYSGSQLTQVRYLDATNAILARELYTWDVLGHSDSRWGPIDEADYVAQSGMPDLDDYYLAYTASAEGRLETVDGPIEGPWSDLTTFEWTDGVVTGEYIDGVTDIIYTYDTDYPRRTGAVVGGTRTVSRTYERGLWLKDEEYAQGADILIREFGDWDEYGQPGFAEATLNGLPQSRYDYTTDVRGRLLDLAIETAGTPLTTVSYDYYANGELHEVDTGSWAGGYRYVRSGGHLQEIRQLGTGGLLASFGSWDGLGRAQGIALSDGGQVDRAWDQNGRIAELNITNSALDVVTRTYAYDDRGRLDALVVGGTLGMRTDEYDYREPGWLDVERRFVGTGGATTIAYDYDAGGNRTERNDGFVATSYEYTAGNRLHKVDGVPVTWDAFGGITMDHRGFGIVRGPDGYELGLDDPLGAPLYDFVRDAFGRQVGVDDGTVLTQTVWGNPGADLPLATIDEDGTNVLNVAAEGLLLGQLRDGVPGEAVSDYAGSLVLLGNDFVDLAGSWGDEAVAQPVGTAGTERYVFAGLQSLPNAPYQMARQRLYDPEVGRFASMDPIGLAGGDHRFGYANGNPMGFKDAEGLSAQTVVGDWSNTNALYEPPPDWSAGGSALGGGLRSSFDQFKQLLGCDSSGRCSGKLVGMSGATKDAKSEVDPEKRGIETPDVSALPEANIDTQQYERGSEADFDGDAPCGMDGGTCEAKGSNAPAQTDDSDSHATMAYAGPPTFFLLRDLKRDARIVPDGSLPGARIPGGSPERFNLVKRMGDWFKAQAALWGIRTLGKVVVAYGATAVFFPSPGAPADGSAAHVPDEYRHGAEGASTPSNGRRPVAGTERRWDEAGNEYTKRPDGTEEQTFFASKGAAAASKASQKAAEKALKTDKDFRRWFHREYKGDQGVSAGGRSNPDLEAEQVAEAYEEWLASGSPKVK